MWEVAFPTEKLTSLGRRSVVSMYIYIYIYYIYYVYIYIMYIYICIMYIKIYYVYIYIILYIYIIEGSLEVKLPTIWTDEKQRWKGSERREE